ncbi:MAG: hypothetical protein IJ228_12645 [Succinivibrio sp.]|nr:hypothetical protein [Succinivibrio sp.]
MNPLIKILLNVADSLVMAAFVATVVFLIIPPYGILGNFDDRSAVLVLFLGMEILYFALGALISYIRQFQHGVGQTAEFFSQFD